MARQNFATLGQFAPRSGRGEILALSHFRRIAMFDRFDNWLMDRLVRLYVAASARRRRRLGLAAHGDFEGVRFIDTDAGQARFVYSYRLPHKSATV